MTFPQRWSKTFKLTSKTVPARKERLKEKMAVEKKVASLEGGMDIRENVQLATKT